MRTTVPQCSMLAPQQGAPISSEQLARHEGLVQWVVRRQYLGDLCFADALHEGRIGLWRALIGYDPARGTAFSSYAVPAITHAVWSAVNASPTWSEQQPSVPSPAEVIDPVDSVYRAQIHARLRALVEQLPSRLRLVIVAHYGLGDDQPQSYAAIARTLGVTRQRVQQLHVEALLWLAHPAHSLPLRRLLDRASRADHQRALAWVHQVMRRRRSNGRRQR